MSFLHTKIRKFFKDSKQNRPGRLVEEQFFGGVAPARAVFAVCKEDFQVGAVFAIGEE